MSKEKLIAQMAAAEAWLTGKYSHVLNLVLQRFTYLRQFSPALLEHLEFRLEEGAQSPVMEAVQLLRELNRENKRKLPDDWVPAILARKCTLRRGPSTYLGGKSRSVG